VIMSWVIEQVRDKVTDPRRMRALAFAGKDVLTVLDLIGFCQTRLPWMPPDPIALSRSAPAAGAAHPA
jgi:hypothetical protein